ncbi:MAG: VOC family protein [Acidimicrobiia bacterium]|nr:VOC family protein [Acidimicrobiia bacterium]
MSSVVVNTTDVDRLAEFWGQLLGVDIDHRSGEWFIWLKPQPDLGVSLAFQKVSEPTPGPRRLHVDLGVDNLDEAEQQALSLGASRVAERSVGDFTWRVMADPDGNEFCMSMH